MKSRAAAAAAVLVVLALAAARGDAPPGRYQVNPPEVRDTETGLIWVQTAPASGGDDGSGGFTWANAKSMCSARGAGWRLPTIKELLTIVDVTRPGAPTIDPTAFPGAPNVGFWSATPFAGTPANNAWFVSFDYGGTGNDFVTQAYRARCVRTM